MRKELQIFRYSEFDIELIPGSPPSPSQLNAMANAVAGVRFQQVTVKGVPVLLNPQAQLGWTELQKQFGPVDVYAMFWASGVYYQARAYSPFSGDDVLGIISSLQPVQ
jgi:hypothetical protein